ncbi:putative G-protein coupled receptor F59B2.13 [Pomacea canaliculata]|uniref:putative G-protein coupled receptor F59B2.13 n=1 Tax=Pomacea canaliculata TaxID=400727 RepID=UPI000D729D3F|nr:putative G-protein coupled receptor F59B2.13 [Pomacea canaliculata]XP_025094937.1 putative G-protein coupled receptor F59B2.13 [Pomacea canaliculata]
MNNTNDTESELFQYYRTIEYQYYKVYIWVLVGVGVPGNVACILVTTSMTLTTATLYMSLLAVADLLALVLKLIFHQMYIYEVPLNTIGCKMEVFVALVSCYANWTLVLVCLERFLSIRFPLKKKIYFTKNRPILIAVLLGMILCLCNLYAFIQLDHREESYCSYPDSSFDFVRTYWYWITAFIYYFLPFILLLIFPFLIIVSLRRQRKAREAMVRTTPDTSGETTQTRVEVAISVMVVCDAIVVFVTFAPICILNLIKPFDTLNHGTIHTRFTVTMLEFMARTLSEVNYAVDFVIYFAASKKFRSRFKKLIRKCLTCRCRRDQE